VTVVIYANNTPANGGTLLGSFQFDSTIADGTLGGGSFSTPISLTAGNTYFVGFENVGPMGQGLMQTMWMTSESTLPPTRTV
jgi:hypothetical protein